MTMSTTRSSAQVDSYARDGFLSPLAALTREEAMHYRRKLEAFEGTVGGPLTSDATDPRYRSLVYASTWFIKEPYARSYGGYHAAYAEQVALGH